MSDDRYYNRSMWTCPLCGYALEPTLRDYDKPLGSMKLVHGKYGCERDLRQYYYPQRELTEVPEEFR